MAEGKKEKATIIHADGWCLNKEQYIYLENEEWGRCKEIDFYGNAKDSGKLVQIILYEKNGKYAVNLLKWKTAGVKHKLSSGTSF